MKIICEKCDRIRAGTDDRWYRFFVPPWMLCWGHNIKVSELECMTKNDLDIEDIFMISDMSEKKSKQIKIGELIKFIKTKI